MTLGVLIVVFVLVVALYVTIQRLGGFRFPWLQFYVRGKESGFSFREINLLRKVAVSNRLKTPASLFWSIKTLDRCIRSAIVGFRAAGTSDAPRTREFLIKLFDFRKRVEFDQPKYRLGISSSRAISPGQTFKITLEGGGVYVSKLIENNRRYMALTYPRGNPLPPGFIWRNQELRVYFWRQEDAGYYFESKVIGDYLDRKVPILHVSHSDSLVRAQKRKSVRRDADVSALLFPLSSIRQANETVASSGGYRCKLLDVSEDGAAVAIGGRAKAGLAVKVQAKLYDEPVILNGVIKSVSFKQRNRASVLHIQAQPPSPEMRIRILAFVYGLFNELETKTKLTPARKTSPGPRDMPSDSEVEVDPTTDAPAPPRGTAASPPAAPLAAPNGGEATS